MGKDRRIFNKMVNNEGTVARPGRIIIPNAMDDDDLTVFILKNSKGQDTYVQEVPRCRFRGVPICLACQNKKNVVKVNGLTRQFAYMWKQLIDNGVLERY